MRAFVVCIAVSAAYGLCLLPGGEVRKANVKIHEGTSTLSPFGPVVKSLERLDAEAGRYLDPEDDALSKAVAFAFEAHSGQVRKSGEPFIVHPIETAAILAELRLDQDTLIAGLLHDTIEDTEVTLDDIRHNFGDKVATIVAGVSDSYEDQSDNQRSFFLALSTEWRVGMVKLADRLHNMRTLGAMPRPKQVRKSEETMRFFVPLAHTFGLKDIEEELKRLSSAHLQPLGPLGAVPGAALIRTILVQKRHPLSTLDAYLANDDSLHPVQEQLKVWSAQRALVV